MILAQYKKIYSGSEELRYFASDNLGSGRVSYNSTNGDAVDKFSYSAFGEYTQTLGVSAFLANFTGKEYDETSLLYFNARYYDPEIGRFIQEDPSAQGTSWYTYCGNNPINAVDPDGEEFLVEMRNFFRTHAKNSLEMMESFNVFEVAVGAVGLAFFGTAEALLTNNMTGNTKTPDEIRNQVLGVGLIALATMYVLNSH